MGELGLALIAGALTTLNPCVFPILPLVVGSAVKDSRIAPLLMGVGMATAFALMGSLTGLLTGTFGFDQDLLRQVSAVLMIIFGLALLLPLGKAVFARLLSPLADRASALGTQLSGSYPLAPSCAAHSLGMGLLLGFVWTPCSGPLLASTLTLAATGDAANATLTLATFGLGAAIPLISVGYLSRAALGRLREWVLAHSERTQQLLGALLASIGLMVMHGADKVLESALIRLLPSSWLSLTTRF